MEMFVFLKKKSTTVHDFMKVLTAEIKALSRFFILGVRKSTF